MSLERITAVRRSTVMASLLLLEPLVGLTAAGLMLAALLLFTGETARVSPAASM